MSRHGDYEGWFGGELRQFRLAIGQLRKLQETLNAGPVQTLRKIAMQDWWVDDLREIIKWGLIGGGMKPNDVGKLLVLHFDGEPPADFVNLASEILAAGVYGPEDETLPKSKGEEASATSKTESSPSPNSTDGAESSPDTEEKTSTTTVFGNSRPSSPDISAPTILP